MATPRRRFALASVIVVAAVAGLVVFSLSATTTYYKTPKELLSGSVDPTERVRVAGNVVAGSVERDNTTTSFSVTDGVEQVSVTTQDALPDTFREGVEVIAEGSMTDDGVFVASTVLAKCPSKFKAKQAARTSD
jgi:cytochrome c-type biogenesis protein CcmE